MVDVESGDYERGGGRQQAPLDHGLAIAQQPATRWPDVPGRRQFDVERAIRQASHPYVYILEENAVIRKPFQVDSQPFPQRFDGVEWIILRRQRHPSIGKLLAPCGQTARYGHRHL
jgi:hypothetical protein